MLIILACCHRLICIYEFNNVRLMPYRPKMGFMHLAKVTSDKQRVEIQLPKLNYAKCQT